jgi:hypothetical protein
MGAAGVRIYDTIVSLCIKVSASKLSGERRNGPQSTKEKADEPFYDCRVQRGGDALRDRRRERFADSSTVYSWFWYDAVDCHDSRSRHFLPAVEQPRIAGVGTLRRGDHRIR